jgi:phosphoribosylformimino-5-aminoimidazole carboxamide ribotide isomerase
VQVGGGLRTLADLRGVFAAGASRAVLGTGALVGDLLHAAVGEFGDGVVVSLDARGGFVATGGWQQTSVHPVLEIAQSLHRAGVSRFVYTDVARDGMLGGPDLVGLRNLLAAVAVPVILSGGIASTDDLRATAGAGAEGVIIGRALYEGHIALSDAIRIAGGTG